MSTQPDPIRDVLPFARYYFRCEHENAPAFVRRLRVVIRATGMGYLAGPNKTDREVLSAYYKFFIAPNEDMLDNFRAYKRRLNGDARATDPVPVRSTVRKQTARERGKLPTSIVPKRKPSNSRLLFSGPVMQAQQRAARERHAQAERARARERQIAARLRAKRERERSSEDKHRDVLNLVFRTS
jgi:hypothetical protein